MEEKLYYPVHYRDYIDGRYNAWLGEPRKTTIKPDNIVRYGKEMDFGTSWFDTKKEAIEEINNQCTKIIQTKDCEYYGENQ